MLNFNSSAGPVSARCLPTGKLFVSRAWLTLRPGALANAHYPSQDRGARLVVRSAAIGISGRKVLGSVQEFMLHKWTTHTPVSNNLVTSPKHAAAQYLGMAITRASAAYPARYYVGKRAIPSLRILFCSVVRFSPKRSAAPPCPEIFPCAALSASTTAWRSAS